MAVSYDAVSQPALHSSSGSSFTWNHVPGGTPSGVLVFTFVNANSDDVSSVSYGASSMTAVSGGRANNGNATYPGDCKAWFLGSSVPTGTQTITVNRSGTNNIFAIAMTFLAATNTEVYTTGIVLLTADATSIAQQSVTDGSPGTNSLRVAGVNMGIPGWNEPIKYGVNNNILAGANSVWADGTANNLTSIGVIGIYDYGTRGVGMVRETANGQGSRNVGFAGTVNFAPPANTGIAAVHLAVREAAASSTSIKDMLGVGIIPWAR